MAEKKKIDEKTAKQKTKKQTTKKKETKKNKAKESYIKQVRKELKLVKWPTFKEVLKYTGSTIVLCLIICAFFLLLNLLLSIVKGMFV